MNQYSQILLEVEERFGTFIAEQVNCQARVRDRHAHSLPRELMAAAANIGLMAFTIPQTIGGAGRTPLEWGLALQAIGYLCDDAAFPLLLGYRGAVCNLLYETGRKDLINRYARPMAQGKVLGSFAYTEGNDPFSFQTMARQTSDGYTISGTKVPVAGGTTSDVFLTFVRRDDANDLMAVLIERDDPGVEITPFETTGLRSLGLAKLQLHDVKIGEERVVAAADALSLAQRFLNGRRLTLPCWIVGRMEALLEQAVADLSSKVRYQLPLTEMQTVQAAVGRMYTAVSTSRLVVNHALERTTSGQHDPMWDSPTAMSKYYVVEKALELCRTAQYVVGGTAVFSGSIYERCMRDFHCLILTAGTQAILETDLGIIAINDIERKIRAIAPTNECK